METARELFAGRPQPVSPAGVLARVREARQVEDAAAAEVLCQAVAWAHQHPAEVDDACTFVSDRGEDTGIAIAGEGAPAVSEFAVIELATALGLSDASGRALVGQALELAHRLPRVWDRVVTGDLAPWRARRIAERTTVLSPEAVAYVDVNVAPFAHKLGPAATQRLVEEAIARFMPDYADQLRQAAADGRHFTVEHTQVSFEGTSAVHGELDLADALDLDAAVAAGADQLAALGCAESLDVRRARAVGEIARTQVALALDTAVPPPPRRTPARRDVTLYVHLAEQAVTGTDGTHLGRVENRGPHLVTAQTIRQWLAVDGATVRVQPVIDLNDRLSATSHELPDRMTEQATLRDQTCTFPHCSRPARGCDDEHCVPWDAGGPTSSTNTAKVCRKHHRAKTHGGWTYRIIRPGTYEWTSPHGYRYLRDPSGTVDLNPLAAAPPHPLEEWDDLDTPLPDQ
ncbi:MAG TPA: DUF222 domain-containing protein [Marmoricola sp.]|nr:DUF222 domain-containing protein [Marmoricola sp.]